LREEKVEVKKVKGKAVKVKQERDAPPRPRTLVPAPVTPPNAPTTPTVLIPSQKERDHQEKVEQGLAEIARLITSLDKRVSQLEEIPADVQDLKRHVTVLVERAERVRVSSVLPEDDGQDGPDWENIRGEVSSEHPSAGGLDDKLTTIIVSTEDAGEGPAVGEVQSSGGEEPLTGEASSETENTDPVDEDDRVRTTAGTPPPAPKS
jgi:hypothetical protein